MRSPVIVAGRGIDRDKGNDLAVDLYIDLINTVAQILIVMRRDTVIFQQTLFKPGYVPRGVIAAVGIPQPRRAHDGFHGLDRLAAPGDLHVRAPGVVQQLPRFIGQQLLVGMDAMPAE